MRKIIVIVICIGAIFGVGYLSIFNKSAKTNAILRIAIFTPTTHLALEEIEQGFKETLQKSNIKQCVFTTLNANGNRTLLRAQAEEIMGGNYDMIFTIGAFCSQTIAELLQKKISRPRMFLVVWMVLSLLSR